MLELELELLDVEELTLELLDDEDNDVEVEELEELELTDDTELLLLELE